MTQILDSMPAVTCRVNAAGSDALVGPVMIVSSALSGGGAERFASTLVNHLNRDRFNPQICLLSDKITYPLSPDIPHTCLGYSGPLSTLATVNRLRQIVERVRPRVVMSHEDYTGLFVGAALRRCDCDPVWVARTSNNPLAMFSENWRWRTRKAILKRLYPKASYFVANSHGLGECFQEIFACSQGKMRVIPNPVDIDGIEQLAAGPPCDRSGDEDKPTIVWMARLARQKRPDVMIEAFRLVRQQRDAQLWLCGDGPLKNSVAHRIQRLGLEKNVKMLGFCANPFPLLRRATVSVMTSDFEGLPNAILESHVLGVPVVAADCPFGPNEIIEHERTGLLTETGNADDVAAAIIRLLDDRPFRQQLAATAKERVRANYNASRVLKIWEDFLSVAAA